MRRFGSRLVCEKKAPRRCETLRGGGVGEWEVRVYERVG